jgi:hypothetical protein
MASPFRFSKDKYADDDADFSIPSRDTSDTERISWGNAVRDRGLSFLMAQPAWPDLQKGRNLIYSMETYDPSIEGIPDKLSRVRVPRIKRNTREIVATLSNLRPTSNYVPNDPQQYEQQANIFNKTMQAWYFEKRVDRSIRKALQYAATEGTGYLYMTWEQGWPKLTALGAASYIPFQQGMDNEIQNTEIGIVVTEVPLQKARRIYKLPHLQASRSQSSTLVAPTNTVDISTNMSAYHKAAGPNRGNNGERLNVPTVDILHLYIKDDSINNSGAPVKMGSFDGDKPLDDFSYVVPYVGQPLPTGRMTEKPRGDQPGSILNLVTGDPLLVPETRPATEADCKLYPNLRLIQMTPTDIIYDGPSFFWHGKIPIVQFRLDDWPWNFLGFSLIRDTWRLEESINARLRARDDAMMARLNPALLIDSRMSDQFDDKANPRIPGFRAIKVPMVDSPVEPMVPAAFFQMSGVDAEIAEDEKRLDFLMGISAIDELMKLKQMPQSDSLDKVIGASTNIIIDIARNMETAVSQIGEFFMYMIAQYMTTGRRVHMLGEDGISIEDFDFDPGNLVPSHLPGEDPNKPSRASRIERMKVFMSNFSFKVIPNSYTQISSITRRMLSLQLWRDKSFPYDPWTFAEDMERSIGPPPPDAPDMLARWMKWQEMLMKMQGAAQEANPEGRPPSGNQPPKIVQKDGGARQTVTES